VLFAGDKVEDECWLIFLFGRAVVQVAESSLSMLIDWGDDGRLVSAVEYVG
jgi:hypothetical protein